MSDQNRFTRRRLLKTAGSIALLSGISAPAILRAQTSDVIRIGHLTPRTGFLGPLGEYAVMAIDLAVEEINAGGGMMGRKVELLKEDSVNPQTASTKAERMIERDKVACIIGEISSASCLTIAQVAERNKTLFINTGGNSDALRGKDCKRYMFHVESQNSMYVKTVGRSFLREGLVTGKKWYSLTADYAFGHDLLKVSKRFMEANGGNFAGDDLVPTDATDFSAYLLKIRDAKPDLVVINLAGNQITNFLKQYAEFGLTFPVGGFGFDTALAWAAGNQDRCADCQRDQIGGLAEDHRAFRKGRQIRRAQDASGLFPRLRPSADARDVRGHRAPRRQDQEPVGHLHLEPAGAGPERGSRSDRRDQGREQLHVPELNNRQGPACQSTRFPSLRGT